MNPHRTRRLQIFITLGVFICSLGQAEGGVKFSAVPADQVIDADPVRRHRSDEAEVIIVQTASLGLLTFYLNGQPVAKIAGGQMVPLYLAPGHYRFGVEPSYNFGRAGLQQVNAEITREPRQIYRIFQSAGFSSSGGNAVYDISPIKHPRGIHAR